jgi:hypothetical protein
LIDKHGNYIRDDKGEKIRISEDQIESLKENDLYEESYLEASMIKK